MINIFYKNVHSQNRNWQVIRSKTTFIVYLNWLFMTFWKLSWIIRILSTLLFASSYKLKNTLSLVNYKFWTTRRELTNALGEFQSWYFSTSLGICPPPQNRSCWELINNYKYIPIVSHLILTVTKRKKTKIFDGKIQNDVYTVCKSQRRKVAEKNTFLSYNSLCIF